MCQISSEYKDFSHVISCQINMYFDVSVSKKAGWQQIPCHIVGISIVITEEGAYDRKDRIPCKPVAGIHMILVQ